VVLHARVETFDERRGDGRLLADNGERLYFHCVDIADGTRTIGIGERVTADRTVGHLGHDEAVEVTKQPER
jgi:cold shock CspA family protein